MTVPLEELSIAAASRTSSVILREDDTIKELLELLKDHRAALVRLVTSSLGVGRHNLPFAPPQVVLNAMEVSS